MTMTYFWAFDKRVFAEGPEWSFAKGHKIEIMRRK